MIDLKQRAELRQEGARIAGILIALHKMFPRMRGLLRWYQFYRQLEQARKAAEEKRIAELAETKTTVLPAIRQHISAKVLLLGIEDERNTDEVEAKHTTRKLSKEWLIETEQRAVIRKEV